MNDGSSHHLKGRLFRLEMPSKDQGPVRQFGTMYQAIRRKFVARTLFARTCLSVTSHLVQVVQLPSPTTSYRTQFSRLGEDDGGF